MTPQEQQMIDGLITRIRNTQITDKDADAAARLQQGLANDPDAIYILAQTVLVQQHSLEQAHAQLEQMESDLEAARGSAAQRPTPSAPTSWLDRFFGPPAAPPQQQQYQPAYQQAPPPPPYTAVPPAYPPPGYAEPGYAQPPYAQPGYASPMGWGQPGMMGGGGSFLRTAVQTAAGVAAGEMLFQGVESMFGGGQHGGGFGGGGETINNYYEDRSPTEHHQAADTDSSFYNPSHDASRSSGAGQSFADIANDTGSDDSGNFTGDDGGGGSDDTYPDDSSSGDDGGSFNDDNS